MSYKAIFLDRDDTLIEDHGYMSDPDQVKLLDGVPQALVEFRKMGYKLIVITNQSAVARGIVTEKALGRIHDRMKQLLADGDAFLDRIYYCPYHPDGVIPKYRKVSQDRKPGPGMLVTAAKEMDIELAESWMIGNGVTDIEAGFRAGCRTILVEAPSRQRRPQPSERAPDFYAVNLKEAVNVIKQYNRSSRTDRLREEMGSHRISEPQAQSNQSEIPTSKTDGPEPNSTIASPAPKISVLPSVEPSAPVIPKPPEPEQQLVPAPAPAQQSVLEPKTVPEQIIAPQPPANSTSEPVLQSELTITPEQEPNESQPTTEHSPKPELQLTPEPELKPEPDPEPDAQVEYPAQHEPAITTQQETEPTTTEHLLTGILEELKNAQRNDMFTEFSVMRLMAGIIQVLVMFSLVVTVWLLMSPKRQDNAVFIAIGFAAVLQLMALTFYTMHGRK